MRDLSRLGVIVILVCVSQAWAIEPEKIDEWKQDDARIVVNTPANADPAKPTLLLIYLPPNGSTIEMTAGAKLEPGMDWHYDIQHIAAQTRLLRQIDSNRNIVIAYVEAQAKAYKLTWPTWRSEQRAAATRSSKAPTTSTSSDKNNYDGKIIRGIVDEVSKRVRGKDQRIVLASHSGGGSFLFGYLNGAEAIGENIERIIWIDSNYGYDNEKEHHGEKLLAWLKGDAKRHVIVMAYNDRAATLNGKPFVSETGGTFYRSHKMVEFFNGTEAKLKQTEREPFEEYVGLNGQIHFLLHTNPEKKILHTVLVERNGLLEAMTWNTALHEKWGGEFWGKRAYTDLVQPLPSTQPTTAPVVTAATEGRIPARPANSMGGKAFAESIADLPPAAREAAIVQEITRGNIPDFLRKFHEIRVEGKLQGVYSVMPDYLAIGSDRDFVRMPMTPASATAIAKAFGCVLPTRKMVNDIYAQAEVKLEPKPLTQEREAVRSFILHNEIIEKQREGKDLGLLVAGDKKDIVISNRLTEKPDRVAIYGWHLLNGKPIQPLTTVHGKTYVDYSHGVRLVRDEMVVEGKKWRVRGVMESPQLCPLLTDEGPISADYD